MLERLKSVPIAARVLGFSGLIPFVGLSLLTLAGTAWAPGALLGYGLAILAFMGGIHWGLAMADGANDLARLGASVVWALLGWLGYLVGGPFGLLLLALGFAALLVYDLTQVRLGKAPPWYPGLRWPLTVVVVACLVLAAVVT